MSSVHWYAVVTQAHRGRRPKPIIHTYGRCTKNEALQLKREFLKQYPELEVSVCRLLSPQEEGSTSHG